MLPWPVGKYYHSIYLNLQKASKTSIQNGWKSYRDSNYVSPDRSRMLQVHQTAVYIHVITIHLINKRYLLCVPLLVLLLTELV